MQESGNKTRTAEVFETSVAFFTKVGSVVFGNFGMEPFRS
jgi:hypothetical protein